MNLRSMIPLVALLLVAGSASAQTYYVAGGFQGWDIDTNPIVMVDDGTLGDATAGDGIYSVEVVIADAGHYQFKVVENTWDTAYPGANSWFVTDAASEPVLFTYDTNVYGDGRVPDGGIPHSSHTRATSYVVVGDLGDELGGADWDPANANLTMQDLGGGIVSLTGSLPAGTYEWKIACNGGWDEQFGADGPSINGAAWALQVLDAGTIEFRLDTNTGRLEVNALTAVDNAAQSWGDVKASFQQD